MFFLIHVRNIHYFGHYMYDFTTLWLWEYPTFTKKYKINTILL